MDNNCECVIGLYYRQGGSSLVSLSDLKWHIQDAKEFNAECKRFGMSDIVKKEYTLRDYADKRKSTNLTRFNFCPMCGKEIDWAAIRRIDNE